VDRILQILTEQSEERLEEERQLFKHYYNHPNVIPH
jgi:hypothetical protein